MSRCQMHPGLVAVRCASFSSSQASLATNLLHPGLVAVRCSFSPWVLSC
jgi:hypothetical protein